MARSAQGVRMWLVGKAVPLHTRHPELVSPYGDFVPGSIVPHSPSVAAEKWTLKQVQGDDAGLVG